MKKTLAYAAFVLAVAAAVFSGQQVTSAHDWPAPQCPPTCQDGTR